MSGPRVLLIQLEFSSWRMAKSWSYAGNFAFEDGLTANHVETFVLPALREHPSSSPSSWLYYARELTAGRKFDQVWVWLIHNDYDQRFLEWVSSLAPVRVGVLMESLDYRPEEYAQFPHLKGRRESVESQLRYMTHVVAPDEFDAESFRDRLPVRAIWYPTAVPKRYVCRSIDTPPCTPAAFSGEAYSKERASLLAHPLLQGLLARPEPPESPTPLPRLFDELHRRYTEYLEKRLPMDERVLFEYVRCLRQVRQAIYSLWFEGIRRSCASVNLPSLFKAYAGRVVESMAAGRPVISWEVPDRPRNRALFEDGKEILLFPEDDPAALAAHIRCLQGNPELARRIAESARAKVLAFHTAEARMRQVLDWIDTGVEPDYGERATPAEAQHRFPNLLPAVIPDSAGNSETFFIKPGYVARSRPSYFTDPPGNAAWQPDVYPIAAHLGNELGCSHVIDLGCGSAQKLVALFSKFQIIGIDHGANIQWCRQQHPFGQWIECDLETDAPVLIDPETLRQSVVICSDVIEHLANPLPLLRRIKAWMDYAPVAILTTPERDLTRGPNDCGPPANPCHVREWNLGELELLLRSEGLNVPFAGLTNNNSRDREKITSIAIIGGDHPASALGGAIEAVATRWLERLDRDPLVSVIVPTYSRPEMLRDTLRSVLGQTFQDFEIIVVNDAGVDVEHVLSPLNAGNNITYIKHARNRGLAGARNTGIKVARGKYIAYLDDDDVYYPDHLATLVDALENGDYRVAYTDSCRALEERRNDQYAVVRREAGLSHDFNRDLFLLTNLTPVLNVMHEKRCLEAVGLFDEALDVLEDWELWIRLSRRFDFLHIPKVTAEVRWRSDGSQMGAEREKRFAPAREYIFKKHAAHFVALNKRNQSGSLHSRPRIALIYDNTVRPDTTGEYCQRALRQLADVTHFLPSRLQEIPSQGFDLYLHIDDSLKYTLPSHLRPSAWWVIDTHLQYEWDREKAKGFDVVFCAQKDGAERLRQDGIRNVSWLPLACDPDVHQKHSVEKLYDVAFVGNIFPGPRAELLGLIRSHFPNSFIGQAYFDEMAKIYSRARIVVNRSIKDDVNMRVFEALASGSLVITNDLSDNGQSELFQDKIHLVTYRSAGELLARIRYYLEREDEREQIARQGREEALARHTYTHRMRAVLDTCLGREVNAAPSVPASKARRASIIILAWNQLEYTRQCVESVLQWTRQPYELILVDNGSTDGTLEYFRSVPGAKVVANGANLGFATGNNRGIEAATGDYIVLLNNDTIVTPGWLEGLISCAEEGPAIGIVGPMSNYVSGPQHVAEVPYRDLPALWEYARSFREQHRGRRMPLDRIVGFCMLITREVITRIGLLDERFGIGNFEDDDYCLRAKQAGFRLVVAGDVFIHHFGGRTFLGAGIDYEAAMVQGREVFMDKWNGKSGGNGHGPSAAESLETGRQQFAEGKVQEAMTAFRVALHGDPSNGAIWNDLACAHAASGNLREAERCLRKAEILSSGEDGAITSRNLGALYFQQQRWMDAIASYEVALAKAFDLDTLVALSDCYLRMGAAESSILGFRKALELAPDHPEAQAGLVAAERLALRR